MCFVPKARARIVQLSCLGKLSTLSKKNDSQIPESQARKSYETQLLAQLKPIASKCLNVYYESFKRTQLFFPDKRLIQYDCGKLQQLDVLLRKLKSEKHRCLIFTQMSSMLNILEIFLNIHG
jgi:SNF2 family DNA or RNA helicase